MALVGPGAVPQATDDVQPMLDGASEFEYVTILNPLSDDFAVRVAQDVPINLPFNIGKDKTGKTAQITMNEHDAAQTYGLSLKNPDFQGRKHIVNDTIIKAGHTINLKGNEAQVAVRQLTHEILQREGKNRLLADPTLRREVEQRIIIGRGSVQDLMDTNLRTTRSQLDEAINRSNEVHDEQAFPGLSDNKTDTSVPERRGPGRPPKTDPS